MQRCDVDPRLVPRNFLPLFSPRFVGGGTERYSHYSTTQTALIFLKGVVPVLFVGRGRLGQRIIATPLLCFPRAPFGRKHVYALQCFLSIPPCAHSWEPRVSFAIVNHCALFPFWCRPPLAIKRREKVYIQEKEKDLCTHPSIGFVRKVC